MARIDVDQTTVLARILDKLRTDLNLSDRQCYESVSPDHLVAIPQGGEFVVAVSGGDGQFQPGEQIVGNITEEWNVEITYYTRIALDDADHDVSMLTNASRGLLPIKKKILTSLVGQDLETEDGDTFLRTLLHATHCSRPQSGQVKDSGVPIAYQTLTFAVDFDWDLT